MFGKLFKHDFKSTAKVMLLFYAALILLSVIFPLMGIMSSFGYWSIFMSIYKNRFERNRKLLFCKMI